MSPDGTAQTSEQQAAHAPAKKAKFQKLTHAELEKALHGLYLEDLKVGMSALIARTVTDADIVLFAGISGDTNPLHMSTEFANGTRFEGRIVHGMLTSALISAVIGTKLPGPGCIYMSQNQRFLAPVRAGDSVIARVTITDINQEKERVTLATMCSVGDTVVVEGEALIKVPRKPEGRA